MRKHLLVLFVAGLVCISFAKTQFTIGVDDRQNYYEIKNNTAIPNLQNFVNASCFLVKYSCLQFLADGTIRLNVLGTKEEFLRQEYLGDLNTTTGEFATVTIVDRINFIKEPLADGALGSGVLILNCFQDDIINPIKSEKPFQFPFVVFDHT